MSKRSLVLIGAGGHAGACIDVIQQEGIYEIVGLVGKNEEIGKHIRGYEVLSDDSSLVKIARRVHLALIAVGQISTPEKRIRLYEKAMSVGFTLASVKSPLAYVSPNAKIGKGTIIMHGAIINAGAIIGNNCIINSNVLIEHDSLVLDHCHISTGALINGNVTVSSGSFIGSGSVIKEGVTVGENSVVGIGSVIRQNLESGSRWIEK